MARTKGSIYFTVVTVNGNSPVAREVRGEAELATTVQDLTAKGLNVIVVKGRLVGNVATLNSTTSELQAASGN